MPELPEVEVVRIGLQELIVGRVVANITCYEQKSLLGDLNNLKKHLVGFKATSVKRRAKILMIELNNEHTVLIHLKMTGQLVFRGATIFGGGHPTDSLINKLPDKSTRITIDFQDGSRLFFNDQRKFGWMKLIANNELQEEAFLKKVGPEPLNKNFSLGDFVLRLKRRPKSAIKAVLLDQTVVAGIGNIYADESLFLAGIHPQTKVNDISNQKLSALYQAIREVLTAAIKAGGSTDNNYVDAKGERGNYLSFAKVFRRENQPCLRCGHLIKKIKVAGRGTHLCTNCQRRKISQLTK